MNYTIDDLKEGRIIVFHNETEYYGIISKNIPNKENIKLACIYGKGGWEKLETILEYKFSLYESRYPIYSFMNLMESRDINFCKKYKYLKEIQKPVSFMEAIKSGKKITVDHPIIEKLKKEWNRQNEPKNFTWFSDLMLSLSQYCSSEGLRNIILEGKWYIKDDEE